MSRYFLEIAYDGTAYNGWQTQPNGVTVQQVIEEKLSALLRSPHTIVGSGRTDTGVHARQQIAHTEIAPEVLVISTKEMEYKLNRMLPSDIAVLSVRKVKDGAHARFDAVARTYQYRISFRRDPFLRNYCYQVWHDLDMEKMQQACEVLKEYEDFSSFCKSNAGSKTSICRIRLAQWEQQEDKSWIFTISADRFLRNMVRAIVGTMVEIGKGRLSLQEFRTVIETKDRRAAGTSAPPQGLFLTRVEYPEEIY